MLEKELEMLERQQLREKVSQREKKSTDDKRIEQFSRIKKDCKGIPFWIPEPILFKDFNIQQVIDRHNNCSNLQETLELTKQLQFEHYTTYRKEYREHREIHDATLLEAKRDWNKGDNSDFIKPRCCFNHYFGLAKKRDGTDYLPIFDYELYLVHNMDVRNFITYVASRGLGKTHTIIQRYCNHRILRSSEWDNQDIALATGLAQINAQELLYKIENMYTEAFPSLQLDFAGNEMYIDKTRIIAFPTENIKRMRLYDKMAAIFIDEMDFYTLNNQARLQEAVFGYIIKSRPLIVFFSTLDKPNGFLARARKRAREQKEAE
jgi:hypothetical protein